jgi:hypothetical protein
MKTNTNPRRPEKAAYMCDITGMALPDGPAATLILRCGYGAPIDGDTYELHFSDEAALVVIPLLRVLLLSGASLTPHLANVHSTRRAVQGQRIPAREREELLRQLQSLVECRRRSEATLRRSLAASTTGETVVAGHSRQARPTSPKNNRQKLAVESNPTAVPLEAGSPLRRENPGTIRSTRKLPDAR